MAEWQSPEAFAIWIGVTLLVVIALISSIILFTRLYIKRIVIEEKKLVQAKFDYQKSLLRDSILVQERERNRISADLHDGLISKLFALSLLLKSNKKKEEADMLLRSSIDLARRISHDLSPPLLDETPLIELLEELILNLSDNYTIKYNLQDTSNIELSKNTKLQIIRIVQEIFNNIVKHSNAAGINFYFRHTPVLLSFVISDNGKGFDSNKSPKGLGLRNIELRTDILKARCKIKSKTGEGTKFIIAVPSNNLSP